MRYVARIGWAATAGILVSWTAPTTNTDGSALTGDDAIAVYRVSWYQNDVFVNSTRTTETSVWLPDLPAGTYKFYVVAIAVDGEESNPWFVGSASVS